jgi:uncharacterized protein YsxB (DUF464 family)
VIRVRIATESGLLRKLEAEGHDFISGAGRGAGRISEVCAAVSALVRTAARTAEANSRLTVTGSAGKEGSLILRIDDIPGSQSGWLQGLTDFIMTGLQDISGEYPEKVILTVEEVKNNGT